MSDTNELLPGTSGASCIAKDEDSAGQDLCGFVDSNGHAYFVDAISRDKFTDREGNEFEFDESENGYYLLKEDGQKAEHFDFDDRNLTLCDTESSILRKSRFLIETMNKRKSSAKISHPIQRSFLISVQDLTRCTYVDSDIDDDEGSESNFVVGDGDEDIDENQEAYLMQILKKDGRVSSSSDDNNGEDEDKFVRNQKPHIRHCGGTVARKMSTTKFARQSCKKNITQKSSKFLDIESPFVYELAEKLCSLNMEKMVELLTRVESFGGRCILEQLLDVLQMMEYDQGGSAVTKSYKPKSAKKCLKNEPKHDNDDFPPFDEKSKVEIEKRREAATKVLQNRIGEIIQSTSFNLDEPPQTPRRGKLAFLS